VNFAPVSDEGEDQQHRSDQKQARGFGGIHGVPVVPLRSVFFGLLREHVDIVALWEGLGVRPSALRLEFGSKYLGI
jgi:hypothetical protein